MSFRIMSGNKRTIRAVVYAFILCFLLAACSRKNDGVTDGTIGDFPFETTKTTETTSAVIDEEETQSNTKPKDGTMPGDEAFSDSSAATISASGNDDTSTAESATTPVDDPATTTSENGGNDMPDYGVKLPDDNWN